MSIIYVVHTTSIAYLLGVASVQITERLRADDDQNTNSEDTEKTTYV